MDLLRDRSRLKTISEPSPPRPRPRLPHRHLVVAVLRDIRAVHMVNAYKSCIMRYLQRIGLFHR